MKSKLIQPRGVLSAFDYGTLLHKSNLIGFSRASGYRQATKPISPIDPPIDECQGNCPN